MAPAGLLKHVIAPTGMVGSSQMSFQGLARLGARKHLNLISFQKWNQLGGLKISLHVVAATAPGRQNLRYWLDSPDNLKRAVVWKAVELVKWGFALEVLIIGMAIEELGKLIPQNARLL
ncbi:unnamed protein product [Sphagnum troendelagicum]|uniref:Uncharacterized protein n=1 Tax=Sphagnum troendelagicum TaxID=128251 RepID=A0ABP0U5D0_9BRYO